MENNKNTTESEKSKTLSYLKSKLKSDNFKNTWDMVKFAVIALLIVIPVRMFIAQPFIVSGESMFPTFHDGQYLIVDEISYLTGEPHRGDVVIFKYPGDTSRYFIKRIIGLPNEKIVIENSTVKIINKEHPEGFVLGEPYIKEKFTNVDKPIDTYETKDKEFFVMGDNRNRSSDSRFWGILPRNLMTGRAYLRLLPYDQMSFLPGDYKLNK